VIPGQLDRRFDRLGTGVREKGFHPSADGCDLRQPFAKLYLQLVIVVGGNVKELRGLLGNGAHNVGMRVAGGRDRDACTAIQIHVAVNVFDDRAVASGHDERRTPRIRRRHDRAIALENRARARAGRRDFDIWNAHLVKQEIRS
jgi:hypothetical protein